MCFKKLLFLILAGIPFSIGLVHAQNPKWINYSYHGEVRAQAEEEKYVWAGTSGGLVRIDRATGSTSFLDKANSGLPVNSVSSIAIDASGKKWIGTLGGGLAGFDGTAWTVYNNANSGLPSNYVHSVAIDSTGVKWIGTDAGLARFDGTHWTVYDTSNSGLRSDWISCIAIDGGGKKWIGTFDHGLAWFDGTTWTAYDDSSSDLPLSIEWQTVFAIAIDKSGNKWIAKGRQPVGGDVGIHQSIDYGGLVRFNGTTWTVFNTSNSGLPAYDVYSIAIDKSGSKWIGTSNGLVRLDGTDWTVYKDSGTGLPCNSVYSILIDDSDNIWIGTNGGGLARFDGINWAVCYQGIPSPYAWSIAIDKNNNKWIGTYGAGLSRFDGTNWTVYNRNNSGLPSDYVGSLYGQNFAIDSGGIKWFGTDKGLVRIDGGNWTVYNTSNSGLPSDQVCCIAIDANGDKWIGTVGTAAAGLTRYDGTNWTTYSTANVGFQLDEVRSIAIDRDGNKWIGIWYTNENAGLAKFDGTNWTTYSNSNSRLPSNLVHSVSIDRDGNKWIGTREYWNQATARIEAVGGLAEFDGSTWTIYTTSNSGLPQNDVNLIAFDRNNTKWIGTFGAGLVRYDDNSWTVYNTANSPLPDNWVVAIAIDRDNNKWIETYYGGLTVFNENGITSAVPNANSKSRLPIRFFLEQNYPNPFNPSTTIKFELPRASNVTLSVFDILGREVSVLVNERRDAGVHEVKFDGSHLSSGVYFYRLNAGDFVQTKKLVILK